MNVKKTAAVILSIMLSFGAVLPSFAATPAPTQTADDDDVLTSGVESEDEDEPQSTLNPVEADKDGEDEISSDFEDEEKLPDTSHAESAILIDMDSQRVLYSKNPDRKLYPASTTKIMTGIIALENGNMDDEVTATYSALASITTEDSHMGILVGEVLTMEQLVKGMLVYSANDAANVIAVHMAGSIDNFVDLMNQKAEELGLTNTHFANVCGTQDENHYTTARDLATLAQYAMKNEQFAEIVRMTTYTIPATNKYTRERNLPTTNLFLSTARSSYNYYAPAIGIKTGHTSDAGYCLVSAAQNNDMRLLAVVLNCDNEDTKTKAYSYTDSKNMFEFGFNNYEEQRIAVPGDIIAEEAVYEARGNATVMLTAQSEVAAMMAKDGADDIESSVEWTRDIAAPVSEGDVFGTITYRYRGEIIGATELVAVNDVQLNYILRGIHVVLKVVTSPFFMVPAIILIVLLIINTVIQRKKKKRRKQRQQRRERERRRTVSKNGRPIDREAMINEKRGEVKDTNSRYSK